MRKLFTEPTMDIKSFAVEDVITTSGAGEISGTAVNADEARATSKYVEVSADVLGFTF